MSVSETRVNYWPEPDDTVAAAGTCSSVGRDREGIKDDVLDAVLFPEEESSVSQESVGSQSVASVSNRSLPTWIHESIQEVRMCVHDTSVCVHVSYYGSHVAHTFSQSYILLHPSVTVRM